MDQRLSPPPPAASAENTCSRQGLSFSLKSLRVFQSVLLISMFHSGLLFSQDTAQTSSVNTKQIEVSLVPDKATIMLGESTYLSFVVKNKSGHDLQVVVGGDYQNGLGRPDSFTVTVVGKDRKQVPQPKTGENMGGIMNAQKISALGNYVFKLFLPHWATFEEPGHYTIRASRILKLKLSDRSDIEWMENTTAMPVEATAEIEVVPLDKEKLGEIIDDLGKNMFASRNGFAARETMDRLKAIHDERVIPYFRLALKTDDYEMKFVALEALSKYNSDAALEGLKEGMATTGTDIGHTTNKEGANQRAANIRHAAGAGLLQSPHPGAIPFLLTQRNDSSDGVRLDVVHALRSKVNRKEAIQILQEMAKDKSTMVSGEALRYLKELSSEQ